MAVVAVIGNTVFDGALAVIATADELHLCNALPTTYAEVGTMTVGIKTTPVIGAAADGDVSGRKVTVAAFADGLATASDDATHFALVKNVGDVFLVSGVLDAQAALTDEESFAVAAFDIEFPDPATT